MIIKTAKYVFGFLAILLATGCATTNFEWVKINPEKIQLAKQRAPYSDQVRQVNLVLQLKSKDSVFYYPESSGFFATEESKVEFVSQQKPLRKNIRKSERSVKRFYAGKTEYSVIAKQNVVPRKPVSAGASNADKLNSALKIPLNSKALKAGKNATSFGSSASKIREMAFNDIKKKNPEIEERSAAKQQRGKNLMWAGLVLVVLGGIMGLVFGRSAFLIALAGIVFAGIGYFFRM